MNLSQVSRLTEDQARTTLEAIRWPDGKAVCPHCGGTDEVTKLEGKQYRAGLYRCADCREQFTVTVGTIMEQSHLPIRTWLMAFALMASSKKGISALQMQRQLGLGSYRSAWHLCHRIRYAMTQEPLAGLLKGNVEVDETYVGGKPRRGAGYVSKTGRGTKKQVVVALVERGGRARSFPIASAKTRDLYKAVSEHVDRSSALHTDDWTAYRSVGTKFAGGHHVVKHSQGEYARGEATTNEVESYFALLKRGIVGSFHSVSRQHMHRYCNEFSFRWDHRKVSDAERTIEAIKAGEGKRLRYRTPVLKH